MDISSVILFIKDLVSTIMILLMMMSPAFGGNGVEYAAEKPDEVIMSFAAVSDIHVETNNPESYQAYSDILYGLKAGKDIDATVFTGDNVMNGQLLENIFFYTALRAVKPAKDNFVVMGNHDIGNGNGDFAEHQRNFITNNQLFLVNDVDNGYYYRVVNGCYMIFLASEELTVNECAMTEEQLKWLEGVLNEAAEKNATIFVFNHHPLYYLRGVESDALAKLLVKYDNLLYIHGHIHDELGADNFENQGGVDTINLPRTSEVVDYEPGDGVVVEVYENEILVRGRDFIKGEWIDGLEYRYPLG